MVRRDEHIGVRVTEAEKEKFEKHLKETNEFDSVPRMFRSLAREHIRNYGEDENGSIDTDELINAMNTALSDVHDRLDRMETHIVSIDSRTSDDDEVDKLAREIYSALPVYESEESLPGMFEIASLVSDQSGKSDYSMAQKISSPSAWAEYFDKSEAQVRRACLRMLEYFPDVEFTEAELGDYNIEVDEGQRMDIQVSERRYYKIAGDD